MMINKIIDRCKAVECMVDYTSPGKNFSELDFEDKVEIALEYARTEDHESDILDMFGVRGDVFEFISLLNTSSLSNSPYSTELTDFLLSKIVDFYYDEIESDYDLIKLNYESDCNQDYE